MSQENVEVARKLADAWNSGGVEALLASYPEDVVWYPFPDAPENASGFHGHDGIRDVMGGWSDSFDDYTAVFDEIRDLGDTVVLLGGGRIGKQSFFPSWEEALEAVGLRE
jgi:ketosteroid isomerase-like protein